MSFYSSIIDRLRGIRSTVSTQFYSGFTKSYVFGTIVSGTYQNFHTDQHPTILCLGSYQAANGKNYTHGIQLHAIDQFDYQWIINSIYMMKRGGQIVNPRYFYQYMKMNRPSIIKKGYRIYHTEMCDYRMISPGFSNMDVKSCYSVNDARDYRIQQLNSMIDKSYNPAKHDYTSPARVAYNQTELNEHIIEAMNSRKIFV